MIYNIAVQKSFCLGCSFEGSPGYTWDNRQLLVGFPESGKEYKSLLYFNLEELKAKYNRLLLLEAHLLLNICLNNITANTSSYAVKALLNPWQPGILPAGIIGADHEAIPFIIPFHWQELISIDITGIAEKWWRGIQPNHGLVIEGCPDANNLLGFSNIGCQQYKNSPQLLLMLRN